MTAFFVVNCKEAETPILLGSKDDGQLELIGRTLKDVTNAALSADNALALLKQALEYAAKFDLKFRPEVLCLTADDRLVELVKRSRAAALTEEL